MNRTLLILAVSLLAFINASAETLSGNIVMIKDMELEQNADSIKLRFVAEIGSKATRSDYALTVIPVLSNGSGSETFAPFVVKGRRAKISEERRYLASGGSMTKPGSSYHRNGDTFEYTAAVPFEQWMENSVLSLEGISEGCCSTRRVYFGKVADGLMIPAPVIIEDYIEAPALSTGDKLAEIYPFFAPDTEEFDINDREGSLTIYFRQNIRVIQRDYMGNNERLIELVSAVRELENSGDSRITNVMLVGFASPEGTKEINTRLAQQRAEAFKAFLIDNTSISSDIIHIYNGEVDWVGLRELVEASGMKEKGAVLDIIDNTPIWDSSRQVGRQGELMRLNGGTTYRYMYNHFFPQLRNATYIKIYYGNISD